MKVSTFRTTTALNKMMKAFKKFSIFIIVSFIIIIFLEYILKNKRFRFHLSFQKTVIESPTNNAFCKRPDLSYADTIAFKYINETEFEGIISNEYDFFNGTELVIIRDHAIYDTDKRQLNTELIEKLTQQGLIQYLLEYDTKFIQRIYYSLQLNVQELKNRANLEDDDYSCEASKFDKVFNKNEQFQLLKFEPIRIFERKHNFTLYYDKHGYYYVKCYTNNNKSLIYESPYYVFPHDMNSLRRERADLISKHTKIHDLNWLETIEFLNKENSFKIKKQMNVLIMAFDSVSYQNFKRIFPITYNYLENVLQDNIIYTSVNVVAENTYPNMVPFLTGLVVEPIQSINVSSETDLYLTDNNQFYDNFPLIWYKYEKLGYVTSFIVGIYLILLRLKPVNKIIFFQKGGLT